MPSKESAVRVRVRVVPRLRAGAKIVVKDLLRAEMGMEGAKRVVRKVYSKEALSIRARL